MTRTGPADAGMSEPVVSPTLVGVGEDGVGLRNLLESLFGSGVVRVSVGMALEREFSIGLLEVGLIRAAIDAVSQWRYKPLALNGTPVAVNTQIDVNFTLGR